MIQFLTLQILKFFDFFKKKKILDYLKKKKFNDFKVVFDVGAHKGESIDLYLKHFNINKIYSFEPNHFSFSYLKKKIAKIKKKNKTQITIENIALGKENKQIFIKHMDESSSSTIKEINTESNYFKKKKKITFKFEK